MFIKLFNFFLRKFNFRLVKQNLSTQHKNLNEFYLNGSDREWQQILMYCHIMEEIKEVPGDIAEFGVAGGTSFLSFVRINKIYDTYKDHNIGKRMLFGFDTFEGLPYFDEEKDKGISTYKDKDMKLGGFNAINDYHLFLKNISSEKNVKIYKGTFEETLPKFNIENKHASFSLIHIDCDLHKSTVSALNGTILKLNIGGVILFDEIFHKDFPGETSGFWEVYNNIIDKKISYVLEFKRIKSMPWKWYAKRIK
jgi:hypothetical protein